MGERQQQSGHHRHHGLRPGMSYCTWLVMSSQRGPQKSLGDVTYVDLPEVGADIKAKGSHIV